MIQENWRPFSGGFLLVLSLLFYSQTHSLPSLGEFVLHAFMTAGLLLFFGGFGDGESKRETAALRESLGHSIAALNSGSQRLQLVFEQSKRDNEALARLRENSLTEQKLMQNLKMEIAELRSMREKDKAGLEELADNLARASDQAAVLKGQMLTLTKEIAALRARDQGKLTQILPVGILDSKVADLVRWCSAEAADNGDPIASMILSSLQSLAAVRRGNLPGKDAFNYLKALGDSLARLAVRQGWGAEQTCSLFVEWKNVLNDNSGNEYILYVPEIGSPNNTAMMTGASGANVSSVNCWGIRDKDFNIVYPALVG